MSPFVSRVVMCAVLASALAACDRPDPRLLQLRERIEALQTSLSDLKDAQRNATRELVETRQGLERVRRQQGEAEIETSRCLEEMDALADAFMEYHMKYQRAAWQKAAEGEKLGDVMVGPVLYKGVTVVLPGWEEFTIRHDGGVTKVAAADLPIALRRRMGMELPEPLAALSSEEVLKQASLQMAAKPDASSSLATIAIPPRPEALGSAPANPGTMPHPGKPPRRPLPPRGKGPPSMKGGFQGYTPMGKNYKSLWHDYRNIGGSKR